MKTKLFEGLKDQEIIDNLEAENCGVEDGFSYVRPFTDDELSEIESEYIEQSKKLAKLKAKLKEITKPINEEIKPLEKQAKENIEAINRGGEWITDKVYCFPEYNTKVMGLYDDTGTLVGTRPMTRAERQLHINSFKKIS